MGSNAFGFETVDGEHKHAIAHYLEMAKNRRVDLEGMLTHTFSLDDWRGGVHGARHPGRFGCHKSRVRLP